MSTSTSTSTGKPFLVLSEEEFYAAYDPQPSPDGTHLWEHHETLDHALTNVWTVVEIDGEQYALPGYHVVNRLAYMLTAKPWEHDNIEVRLEDDLP